MFGGYKDKIRLLESRITWLEKAHGKLLIVLSDANQMELKRIKK